MTKGSPYASFKTDAALETAGIVLDYGGFRLRIARAGGSNKRFQKVLELKLKPYRRQIQTETLADEVAQRLMIEAYAEAVVLGWDRPVADAEGKIAGYEPKIPDPDLDGADMEFSRENCIRLLTGLPELFRDVQEQAAKAALFRQAEQEEAEGNSAPASATT